MDIDIAHLKKLFLNGELEEVIERLKVFIGKYYTRLASDVLLISSRFNQVTIEMGQNKIGREDYSLEMESIRAEALRIIRSVEELGLENYREKDNKEDLLKQIKAHQERFEKSRGRANKIRSNAVRLREKNSIARELGDIFISSPELIEDYYKTDQEGIITGIANRFKRVPESSSLAFFESVELNSLGNFTKCCVVNALMELIYSGQLLAGDEKRVDDLLDELYPKSHHTVKQNIIRVNSELDYYMGKIKAPEGL